ANAAVLVLHDKPDTGSTFLFHGILKARNQWNDNNCLPCLVILTGTGDSLNEGIADLVVHCSAFRLTAGYEELILDIDEMVRLFDHFDVGIHDAVLCLVGG